MIYDHIHIYIHLFIYNDYVILLYSTLYLESEAGPAALCAGLGYFEKVTS